MRTRSAAVNAGFFVFDPAAGAEGDPAGAGVYDGELVSETIGSRPVLVLDAHAERTDITRPSGRAACGCRRARRRSTASTGSPA